MLPLDRPNPAHVKSEQTAIGNDTKNGGYTCRFSKRLKEIRCKAGKGIQTNIPHQATTGLRDCLEPSSETFPSRDLPLR